MKIMGSVNHILGMDVRNSVENHTVHLLQAQYIINVYNNFQQYGVYCYDTPMDLKAQLSMWMLALQEMWIHVEVLLGMCSRF